MADSEQFIGSREKARNSSGQNGDPNASSVLPGKKAPPISGNIAPPDASANPGDWQTRPVSSKQAVPTHIAMADNMPASLPGKTEAKRPSSVAATPGRFAR